jgi:trk/ktr system potassium uptake protein
MAEGAPVRTIIVGCGRVGAGLADALSRSGHEVTVVDVSAQAFNRLNAEFPGQAVRGDGTDEEVLRRIGADRADFFFALTEGDNRNTLAAQIAQDSLHIPHVIAKINDPVRAAAYRAMGLAVMCRTTIMVDTLSRFVGLPGDADAAELVARTVAEPAGEPSARAEAH